MPEQKIDITKFHRTKYGRELLIDAGLISENEKFLINDNQFIVDFYEIFVISSGEGIFHLNETTFNFLPGTVMFLPPGKVRRWGERSDNVDAYYLIFEEEFIKRFFRDNLFLYRLHFFEQSALPYLHLDATESTAFYETLAELQEEINSLREDSDHLLRALLYYRLIKLNRLYEHRHGVKGQPYNNVTALNFRQAIELHFKEYRQVEDYCELLQISRTTLNQRVKEAFGRGAGEMIRNRIVEEAKQMLIYSDERISEIAYHLNFSNVANFNRLFAKITGLSPRQFRYRFTN